MTSSVTLTVFDLLGCEIATLIHTQQDAGVYQLRWNGRNALQQDVSSGVYVYRFTARDPSTAAGYSFISTKKMVLVK
jgi:hypothetical protein